MSVEYRFVTPDDPADFEAFLAADRFAFSAAPPKEGSPDSWARGELERARVAVEDGRVVGQGRLYSFELTLPGLETVPAAAVSWIGVLPTHRRRGVLTGMMATLHDDAGERGEPVAILQASEGGIYGRFGYGIATYRVEAWLERTHGRFARPFHDDGRVVLLDRDEVVKICPPVYDRARRLRPGMVSRPDFWWPDAVHDLLPADKASFAVVHEDSGGAVDGYALYTVEGEWEAGISRRHLTMWDLQTVTPSARVALWRYLLDVDLIHDLRAFSVPIDDPLRFLLADSRRLRTTSFNDAVWVRLLDPAAALAARRYAVDGGLVLEVHAPDGRATRLALEGGPGGASCRATTTEPDLALGVSALGSTYLGGISFAQLAAAGLLEEHRDGARARADAMFASHPAPALTSWF